MRASTRCALAPVAVSRLGTGPEVVLMHGGASPTTTWAGLEPLAERWQLTIVYRRGFAPSPMPPGGKQDYELDAADLLELLKSRPHVVGHSYGGVAAAIAASLSPGDVRSLTLIEPALFLADDNPEVARLRRMGDTVLQQGLASDPATLREFLRLAGSPVGEDGALADDVVNAVRRAQGSRPPSEARPDLEAIAAAGVPALVASGGHHVATESMCDAVQRRLGARRIVCPGSGHFVAAAPGFADQLERFLTSVS